MFAIATPSRRGHGLEGQLGTLHHRSNAHLVEVELDALADESGHLTDDQVYPADPGGFDLFSVFLDQPDHGMGYRQLVHINISSAAGRQPAYLRCVTSRFW